MTHSITKVNAGPTYGVRPVATKTIVVGLKKLKTIYMIKDLILYY